MLFLRWIGIPAGRLWSWLLLGVVYNIGSYNGDQVDVGDMREFVEFHHERLCLNS